MWCVEDSWNILQLQLHDPAGISAHIQYKPTQAGHMNSITVLLTKSISLKDDFSCVLKTMLPCFSLRRRRRYTSPEYIVPSFMIMFAPVIYWTISAYKIFMPSLKTKPQTKDILSKYNCWFYLCWILAFNISTILQCLLLTSCHLYPLVHTKSPQLNVSATWYYFILSIHFIGSWIN